MADQSTPHRHPLHVAFAVDEAYLPWCATAALSCIDHTREAITVHVLHDGSLDRQPDAAVLARLLEEHGAEVQLRAVADRRLSQLPSLDRFGRAVWLRFFLPEVLPDHSRVLYLDADTLTVDSIAPLFQVDLGQRPVAAVQNVVERSQHAHVRALGIDPGGFFNSGVLLMDLDRMRAEGSVERLLQAAEENAHRLLWPDQDTLNLAFRDRWHRLHPRWNAQNSFWQWRPLALTVLHQSELDDAIARPGIVHFEGPGLCKPWHALSRHPWKAAFWRTLRRTPWAGLRPEDLTAATRLIRVLPAQHQLGAYQRLERWRRRSLPAAGADGRR